MARTNMVGVRLSDEEFKIVEAGAKRDRRTVNDYLRVRGLESASQTDVGVLVQTAGKGTRKTS